MSPILKSWSHAQDDLDLHIMRQKMAQDDLDLHIMRQKPVHSKCLFFCKLDLSKIDFLKCQDVFHDKF
jgi:hypothetical protein